MLSTSVSSHSVLLSDIVVVLSESKDGKRRWSSRLPLGLSVLSARRAAAQAHSNEGFAARDECFVEKSKISREKGLQGDANGWIGEEGMASQTASESASLCEACRVSLVGVRGVSVGCSARDAIRSNDRKPHEALGWITFGKDAAGPSGRFG